MDFKILDQAPIFLAILTGTRLLSVINLTASRRGLQM